MLILRRTNNKIAGFTLTELMVCMLLGMILIGGALRAFAQARVAWRTAENLAELEDRAAHAIGALEQDIRLAGYWGLHNDGSSIDTNSGVVASCGGRQANKWVLELQTYVAGLNNATNLPCSRGAKAGADSLSVRHASGLPAIPEAGRIQLLTTHTGGTLFQSGVPPAPHPHDGKIFNLEVHGWYIAPSSTEPGEQALRRTTLMASGNVQNQEIIPGVEDFQILLGIDSNADGNVDRFVDPGDTAGNPVHAVHFWLLLRSARPEPGHIDATRWQSIDTQSRHYVPNDQFRRITAERVVWLRNAA